MFYQEMLKVYCRIVRFTLRLHDKYVIDDQYVDEDQLVAEIATQVFNGIFNKDGLFPASVSLQDAIDAIDAMKSVDKID